jgi:chemotaxis-related protein WspB
MQLFLQIHTGDQGYLLEARYIIRVLPLMRIRSNPVTGRGMVGIINYQGSPVSVLDLSEVLLQRPCARRVTTRLILLSVADLQGVDRSSIPGAVALLAEGVSDVIRVDPKDFVASVDTGGVQCLGPTANVDGSLLQKIELPALLNAECLAAPRLDPGHAA